MKTGSAWVLAGLVAVVVAGFAIVGCESTKTTDNVITVGVMTRSIGPDGKVIESFESTVRLTNDYETVEFTASLSAGSTDAALALPLEWTVSDPARGTIRASGGLTAIYEAKNLGGNNTITVKDQGDNEGIAVVIQSVE